MQQRGSVVLDHQVQQLMRGATCYVAGIGDPFSGHDDVEGTLAQVPLAAPFLVLGHSLDVFSRMTAPPALTLAGHTHGGQLWLPFVGRPIVPSSHGQRHAAGHVVEDGDIRSWPPAWA